MRTKVSLPTDAAILAAAKLLQNGEVVAFPTETVYGLGANALDAQAVRKIFEIKGRPADNPLIVHVANPDAAEALCFVTPEAHRLMDCFWPGPLTLLLPKKPAVPAVTNAGLKSVAVRMPDHPVALKLLRAAGVPVAAPSANRSGRPSPTTAQHVLDDLDGSIPMVLDGGTCKVGLESTVLDMTGLHPQIVRPGCVTREMLLPALPDVDLADSAMRPLRENETAVSPGMAHRHYAPQGKLTLVGGEPERVEAVCKRLYQAAAARGEAVCLLITQERLPRYEGYDTFVLGSLSAPETIARSLFTALRRMDELGVTVILCEAMDTAGIGLAIMNRLYRAASFRLIQA